MSVKKYKKTQWKNLIAQGDVRVNKVYLNMRQKYAGVPNLQIIPHFGMGTGTDVIVGVVVMGIPKGARVLEVHEVTNWFRIAKDGQRIFMNPTKERQYIKSLTKKVYKISWGKGQKRFYPTEDTIRIMDISYESNMDKAQKKAFKARGIEIVVLERTDFPLGYMVQDEKGNKKSYYEDGTELP